MAQTILGLDLGSYSIKAALYEVGFKSFQITDLYESSPLRIDDLPKDQASETQMKALEDFLKRNQIPISVVVTSIPATSISYRALKLPFKDKRQVAKVLPFELESFLPFDLQDLIIDCHVTEVVDGHSSVVAVAVKKDLLARYLMGLESIGVNPRIVDVDALALGNIMPISNVPVEGNYGILDIGHNKTSLCLVGDQKTLAIRSFLTAGKAITNGLRIGLDLTFQQAEEVKHKYAIITKESHPPKDEKQRKVANHVRKVLEPMAVEIMQTIHNFESQQGKTIDRLYLCGGSSLIRGIDDFIEDVTGKPASFVQCSVNGKSLDEKIGRRQLLMTQSLALALRTGIRGISSNQLSQINLRKEEFAPVKKLRRSLENAQACGNLGYGNTLGVVCKIMD